MDIGCSLEVTSRDCDVSLAVLLVCQDRGRVGETYRVRGVPATVPCQGCTWR